MNNIPGVIVRTHAKNIIDLKSNGKFVFNGRDKLHMSNGIPMLAFCELQGVDFSFRLEAEAYLKCVY